MGLDSLSRGAASCSFFERDRDALVALRRNLDALEVGEIATVRTGNAWEGAVLDRAGQPGTEIERVVESARRFPGTQVVLGHAGVGDLEGTLHAVTAARATRENENVWIDLSDCRLPAMRTMIEGGVPERLVLSSDDPFGSLERQIAQARQIAGADEELLAKVLGDNAARLYGL